MKQKCAVHVLAQTADKKILLVKRKDVPVWVMPGGRSEKNENNEDTARREFFEETGIVLEEPLKEVCHYLASHPTNFEKYILHCQLQKKSQPKLTDESCDFGYFDTYHLPFPMTRYENQRIEDALQALKTKKIERLDTVNIKKEIIYFLQKPHILVYLLTKFFALN